MKVLCWNMGAAWGRWRDDPVLHDRAWHWVAAVDPDLAFLQEVRPPAWANDRWSIQLGTYQFFASALVTRQDLDLHPLALPEGGPLDLFGSYLATGELFIGAEPLVVASVHTVAKVAAVRGHPGYERSGIARTTVGEPWWNDVAFAAYRDILGDRRFLIAGDWNTSRYEDEHGTPDPAGAEFFERAAAAGWVEVSLDDGREGKTWYGSNTPRPHQADHAFADTATAQLVRSFSIEAWPISELGLSDHAPLLLDIDLEGARGRDGAGSP